MFAWKQVHCSLGLILRSKFIALQPVCEREEKQEVPGSSRTSAIRVGLRQTVREDRLTL